MGAYSPAPVMTEAICARVMEEMIKPTLRALAAMGSPYKGVLYAGVIVTADGPKLVEYNARFGDPECQVLMLRMMSDVVPALIACADGQLKNFSLRWFDDAALTVIMATRGYPGSYGKGSVIEGLDEAAQNRGRRDLSCRHHRERHGAILANGGRVLNVCALGKTVTQAQARAYAAVERIKWPEGFYRRDIGWQAVARERESVIQLRQCGTYSIQPGTTMRLMRADPRRCHCSALQRRRLPQTRGPPVIPVS